MKVISQRTDTPVWVLVERDCWLLRIEFRLILFQCIYNKETTSDLTGAHTQYGRPIMKYLQNTIVTLNRVNSDLPAIKLNNVTN